MTRPKAAVALSTLRRAFDRLGLAADVVWVDSPEMMVFHGWEHLLHETLHYTLATGRLPMLPRRFAAITSPYTPRAFSTEVSVTLGARYDRYGRFNNGVTLNPTLARHELRTLALEPLFAERFGLHANPSELLAKAIRAGNLPETSLRDPPPREMFLRAAEGEAVAIRANARHWRHHLNLAELFLRKAGEWP